MAEQLRAGQHPPRRTTLTEVCGADSFKVFSNGWLFVSKGRAITDGIALMSCSGSGRPRDTVPRGHASGPFGK